MTRNAVVGAIAAVVALGTAAPAAVAAPKAAHAKVHHRSAKAHAKAHHTKAHESSRAHAHVRGTKADRISGAERRLAQQVRVKTRYLGRLADSRKVQRLDDSVQQAVELNIADDLAQLNDLKAAAGTTDAKTLWTEVRSIRPEVYQTIVNELRLATSLKAALAATTDADPALVTQVDSVIEALTGYDANTTRAELRAAMQVISSVADTLDADEADEPEAPESETPGTSDSDTDTETGSDTGTTTS
jgi:hypothetical protein